MGEEKDKEDMDIKQAVEILKTKAVTQDEKLALAYLVCELDAQFCYGWGAGCTSTAEWINKTVFSSAPSAVQEKIETVGVWMASSPKADGFRGEDFPAIEEFERTVSDSYKDEIPF